MPVPVPRRGFLRLGSLALGGLALGDLFRLRAAAPAGPPRDTRVILLWLEGGASQLDTYDPKPDAPAEVRGEFRPTRTAVPGVSVCEHLPLHARLADRFTLVRSVTHAVPDHPGAAARVLTGYEPANISDPVARFPTIEAVTAHARAGGAVPAHVSNVARLKGGGTAYLGRAADPLVVAADPNAPGFRVDALDLDDALAGRLDDRRALLAAVDGWQRRADLAGHDHARERAFALLTGGPVKAALDLSREPARVRDRYGRHEWGQRVLLARRLAEAGCSFVTVQLTSGTAGPLATWDDHGDVGHIFDNNRLRLPILDRCVTALIEDLHARGRDRDVLVLVAGEFGRTPVVNMGRGPRPVHPGRDHWPGAMSVLVAGGGGAGGKVIGATDARAAAPKDRPVDPNDLLATVYRFLGVDPAATLPDATGRPVPVLPHGRPLPDLLG